MSEGVINFCFPIRELEGDQVKLAPFRGMEQAEVHASPLGSMLRDPAAFAHFSSGPYESTEDFIKNFLGDRSYPSQTMFTYVILSKNSGALNIPGEAIGSDEVAGMVSLTNADINNRSAEIGLIQVLPAFRGQGTATQAARLLLNYCLSSPDQGGLGLVRVEWHSTTGNEASIKVANRLGFEMTGRVEYEKLLPNGIARGKNDNGKTRPPDTSRFDVWRDVVIYSMTWESWNRQSL